MMRTFSFVCLAGVLLAPVGSAQAKSLWPETGGRSLVADPIAHQVGDIVTILINETTQAANQATNQLEKKVDGGLSAGQGLLSFIPFFSYGQEDGYDMSGTQQLTGSLVSRMTAVVTEASPGGLLTVEGTRTVEVNGEKQELVLTGKIRAYDISRTNTIQSSQIADAQILYKGRGAMADKHKPGLITRLFDWLF